MNAQAQAERVDDSNLASGGREGEHRKKEKKLKVDPLRVPSATLITKAESVHPHIGKDKEEERNGVVQHANVLIYPGFIVIQGIPAQPWSAAQCGIKTSLLFCEIVNLSNTVTYHYIQIGNTIGIGSLALERSSNKIKPGQ